MTRQEERRPEVGAARARSLWRHGDFMKLWSAQTISLAGSQVTQLALPLTAVLVLHATPLELGWLGTALFLPWVIVGLPAGVWIDHLRRRPVMIAADVVRAAVILWVPIAYGAHVLTMASLYPVAFVSGCMNVFFDISQTSYLPSLVDADQLVDGNAKLEASRSAASLGGPGLGGALVQLLTAPVAILTDAASFLASAVLTVLIRRPEPAPVAPAGEQSHLVRDMAQGFRFVLAQELLRPTTFGTAIGNMALGGLFQSVFLLYCARTLELSPGLIGLLFAIANGAGIVAAVVSERVSDRAGIGPTIIIASGISGLGGIVLPFATPALASPVLAAGMVMLGFGSVMFNVNSNSLDQTVTPSHLLGRVSATIRFLVWGTIPIGTLLWGVLGGTIGLPLTVRLALLVNAVPVFLMAFSPIRRLRSLPAASGSTP